MFCASVSTFSIYFSCGCDSQSDAHPHGVLWTYERSKRGNAGGIFLWLLYDLYFGFAIGPFMIIYMLIGYCNGFFHRLYLVEDVLLPIIIITLDDFIFNFITFIIFFVMRNRLSFGLYMKDIILPDMIYTAILTMIVFKLFVFINKRLKRAEKGSET